MLSEPQEIGQKLNAQYQKYIKAMKNEKLSLKILINGKGNKHSKIISQHIQFKYLSG